MLTHTHALILAANIGAYSLISISLVKWGGVVKSMDPQLLDVHYSSDSLLIQNFRLSWSSRGLIFYELYKKYSFSFVNSYHSRNSICWHLSAETKNCCQKNKENKTLRKLCKSFPHTQQSPLHHTNVCSSSTWIWIAINIQPKAITPPVKGS